MFGFSIQTTIPEAAILLDQVSPDWFNKIDIKKLSMNSCMYCVLGQIFGDFDSIPDTHILNNHMDYINGPFGSNASRSEWIDEIVKRRES